MPDSETFDAFYARTVWNVTNQMHELAGDDSTADHAIREAYAKAYQQWYQVSGYRDTESWVLATAKDAYERRRAGAAGIGGGSAAAGPGGGSAAGARDSGTWPGLFRPAVQPGGSGGQGQPFDPDGTLAPPRHAGAAGGEGVGAGAPGAIPAAWNNYPAAGAVAGDVLAGNRPPGDAGTRGPADDPSGWFGPASRGPATARGFGGVGPDGLGPGGLNPDGLGGGPGRGAPGRTRPGRSGPPGGGLSSLATRRNLIIAGVAVAALVIVGISYSLGGGHKTPTPAASQGTTAKSAGKPKPQMLAAGRTGRRPSVPWSLVGSGWALAEFSTAAPNSAGQPPGSASYTTYLVDPEGGKYKITTFSAGAEPELTAWSGDDQRALFVTASGAGGASSYELLNVRTGQLAQLPVPADVTPVGFARPFGLAILAVHQGPAEFRLQRYSLNGQLQKNLAALPRKAGESLGVGCISGIACAISSPDGLTDVWGIAGDAMQVLSNAGGKATRLHVNDGGHRSSCMPLTWWNDTTILAECTAAGLPDDATRLWLVPDNGGMATALTSATAAGDGHIEGAWLAGQTTYVTSVTSRQCTSAPSGPGGMDIVGLGQSPTAAITIPGTTSNFSTIVATEGQRLLVLTQTQCPGTSSLLWLNPSSHATQLVLTAPPSEVGAIAAVPFGNGPTAVTGGQY